VTWQLPGAIYRGTLDPNFATRDLRGDILYDLLLKERPLGYHVEYQYGNKPGDVRRIWEYNVEASLKYKRPIESIVFNLKRHGKPPVSPYLVKSPTGKVIHEFHFTVINVFDLDVEELFKEAEERDLPGILILAAFCRDGANLPTIERVAIKLRQIPQEEKRQNLIGLAYGVTSSVLEPDAEQLRQLKGVFGMPSLMDVLMESPAFQEIMQAGEQAGEQKAQRKARDEERKTAQQTLLAFIRVHYQALLPLAEEKCNLLKTAEQMQDLLLRVLLAKSEEEIQQILLHVKVENG
jgi:hypothetical protein